MQFQKRERILNSYVLSETSFKVEHEVVEKWTKKKEFSKQKASSLWGNRGIQVVKSRERMLRSDFLWLNDDSAIIHHLLGVKYSYIKVSTDVTKKVKFLSTERFMSGPDSVSEIRGLL